MRDESCELLCLDLPKAESIRAGQPDPGAAEGAATRARALGDPTRLGVAAALAQADELCGCDLAWIVGRSQKLVSHHLRVLREAGLASARREGRMVLFSLTGTGRALLEAVLAGPGEGMDPGMPGLGFAGGDSAPARGDPAPAGRGRGSRVAAGRSGAAAARALRP